MFAFRSLFATFISLSLVLAHPLHHHHHEVTIIGRDQSIRRAVTPELQLLADGNKAFKEKIGFQSPTLLKSLTDDGQTPPFMFLGCSDSRVSEGTIFDAKPGTLFTERNIANQFQTTDANTHSVLSYAVAVLGVKHVIVMGHYGCGGVAAAIATPPSSQVDIANGVVQAWIQPIREIFQTSSRPEIVELRERIRGQAVVEEPDVSEPGFRALVEENVKASVNRIATDSVIANHYALLTSGSASTKRAEEPLFAGDVFIHGWVYDIENGEIRDLGVSVGPPGKEIPTAPFEAVLNAATSETSKEATPDSTSEEKDSPGSTPEVEEVSPSSTILTPAPESTTATPQVLAAAPSASPIGNPQEVQERCEQECKVKRFFMG